MASKKYIYRIRIQEICNYELIFNGTYYDDDWFMQTIDEYYATEKDGKARFEELKDNKEKYESVFFHSCGPFIFDNASIEESGDEITFTFVPKNDTDPKKMTSLDVTVKYSKELLR